MNCKTILISTAVAALATASFQGTAMANDDVAALAANPGNVVMPNINYAGWNYSTLDQITLDNVADLQIAWTWQVGILDSHEASPLVVGDTMYIVSPKPNYVYALDLNNQGVIKWEFRPDMNVEEATRQGCCGGQTRGLNYAEGKVFLNTLDGQFFAIDATTGEAVWSAVGADLSVGETTVGNMIVVGDLLIGGNAGGERGVRGKIQAFNIDTGFLQWVMYSVGPDNEVGVGSRFSAFYADDRLGSLATWYGDSWRRGGGAVWGYFTYEAATNALYYSTGNCGPYNPDYRRERGIVTLDANGGLVDYHNNWCSSLMSRDAATGELLWAYNMAPADNWDFDEPGQNVLADIEIDGEDRETIVKAARNGYFYVFDRHTGEMLLQPWPYVFSNVITGVNMETGRPTYNMDKWMFSSVEDRRRYTQADPGRNADGTTVLDYTGTEVTQICPGSAARNWHNDAWSPRTGLLYTTTYNICYNFYMIEGEYTPGEGYTLMQFTGVAPIPFIDNDGQAADHQNELQANDPVTGQTVWQLDDALGNLAPVLATASDLLFQGAPNQGLMRAIDATSGEIVWTFRTGSRFNQSPITYIGPDGRQFVAIIASSAANNAPVALNAGAGDPNRYRRSGTTLYVFGLPESVAQN